MVGSKSAEKALPLFAGWRAGLARCTGATALVALLNILFLCIAAPRLKPFDRDWADPYGKDASIGGALFEGSCGEAKQLSVWIHLAINILSAVLLASGNYTQQILTAPTRTEIDKAHAKRSWLNVGILSYRNLRRIRKGRVLAWTILALTSIPIHLFYNSVVSLETSANKYNVKSVHANETSTVPKSFKRLDNSECISQYSGQFLPDRSDLYLVIPSDYNNSYNLVDSPDSGTPGRWICSGMTYPYPYPCDVASLKAQPEDWKIRMWPVEMIANGSFPTEEAVQIEYCLSKSVEESCRLAMSIPLMSIVVGCNVFKLIGLGLTWIFLDRQPLLTLGDAVASFLEHPDYTTADSHLLSIGPGLRTIKWGLVLNQWKAGRCQRASAISPFLHAISRLWHFPRSVLRCIGPERAITWNAASCRWQEQRRRWGYFISPSIYAVSVVSSVAVIIASSYLLSGGIHQISKDKVPSFADLWDRGFGSIDADCLMRLDVNSSTETSLLSNTPQIIVSIIYTTVNGMWTAMMVGNEWNGYGLRRKALRTTAPVGQQRRSYWLSLPWRYGLPLIAATTLLHWLISQSIFFVRIIILYGDDVESVITRPGYSPIAIIFAIICGAAIMIATVALSLVPCKTAIPQIGTCSAVLSAACHPPEGDEDAALKGVKWGVVIERNATERDEEERCCITSWKVMAPVEGKSY